MEFRNDDLVAGDLVEIIGHSPVVGYAALKDDVSLVSEEKFTHTGHNGTGLRTAGTADDVPQRETVFEFVDAGGGKDCTD